MTVRVRLDDLRWRNRAAVIAAIRRARQPSRTEIVSATGLSHSTISAISSDLLAEGVLSEPKASEPLALKRGRPQVALCLNPLAATIVTVDLSLNALSAAVFDYAGGVLAEERLRLATQEISAQALVDEMIAMVRRLLGERSVDDPQPLRIVVAVQGVCDAAARSMLWSPITPHTDIGIADALEAAFSIPTAVENDCNMIAYALRSHDPESYHDDFIAILLSHGIGMGMVLKGETFTGTHSSGGEFGHMIHQPRGALCRCGRHGCVEAYAGNYAIWRNARMHCDGQMPNKEITDADVLALATIARMSEGPERDAFRKAGEALGFTLGSLFALIDPAPLAFVGVGASVFDLMEPSLRTALASTVGGQHANAITLTTETDEKPLIREGTAKRALDFIDRNVIATSNLAANTSRSSTSP
ncbi:MAG: ROK family protein [Rhizobiaceae bacterium]|nr:ROK family protein [Rhizobiaceae bacterium]